MATESGGEEGHGWELPYEEEIMTLDELAAKMGPTTASMAGGHVAPYLDVMSIRSCGLGSAAAPAHGNLLVEPISVPSLQHTGIRTTLEKLGSEINASSSTQAASGGLEERPLFYPDGRKKKNLRVQVREALRRMDPPGALEFATALGALPAAAYLKQSDREAVSRECRRHDGSKREPRPRGKPRTSNNNSRARPVPVLVTKRRPADDEAQALLLSIRQEKLRLDRLCLK